MELRELATYEMQTKGVVEATAQFDRLATAQQGAASKADVLSKQVDIQEKSITRVGSRLEAYARSNDPLAKALANVERGERLVAAARAQGLEVTEAQLRAVDQARSRYTVLTGAMNDNSKIDAFHGATVGVNRFNNALEGVRSFAWNNTGFSGNEIDRVINPIQGLGHALGSIPTIAIASAAAAEVALTAIGARAQRTLADLAEASRTSGLSVNQISGAQIVGARAGLGRDETRSALGNAYREFDAYRRNEGGVKDALENIDEGFLKVADRARNAGEFVDAIGEKIRALPREEGLDLSKKLLGDDAGAGLFDNIRNGALSMRSLAEEAARAGSINDDLARRAADVQHQIDEASEIARTKLLVAFQDLGNPVDDLRMSWWRVVGSIGDAISRSEQLRQVMQGMLHPIDTLSNAPRAISSMFEQPQQRPLGRLIDMQAQQDFDRRKADFFARGPQLVQLTAGDSRRRYGQRAEEDGKAAGGGRSAISDATRAEERYQSITRELNSQLGLLGAHGAEHDRLALRIEIERRQLEIGTGATALQKQNIADLVTKIDEATKAQQRLNDQTKVFNEAYGAASRTLSTGFKDVLKGGKPVDALQRVLGTTQDQLFDAVLTGSGPYAKYLGTAGKDGAVGGVFGTIGDIFGLGPTETKTAQMNVQAANVVVNGGLPGVPGAAGGTGGGLLGGIAGWIGGLFGGGSAATNEARVATGFYADGGPVGWSRRVESLPARAFVGAPHFSDGGMIGRPAILHDGEIVMNAMQQRNVAASIESTRRMMAKNDLSARVNVTAPKTEVHVHNAPAGARVEESEDSRGNRRIDVVLNERIAAALGSPHGVAAMHGYGVRPRIAGR